MRFFNSRKFPGNRYPCKICKASGDISRRGVFHFRGHLLGEDIAQSGDVIAPLAEWRKVNRHNGQPVEEILAEKTFFDPLFKITVSRDQNADVDTPRMRGANA